MIRIRISQSAQTDLRVGAAFYERQQQGLGRYFLDALISDIDSLQIFGGVHPKPISRFHRSLSKRFPFAIYYDFDEDTVTVVAVLDCRRNPASIRKHLR